MSVSQTMLNSTLAIYRYEFSLYFLENEGRTPLLLLTLLLFKLPVELTLYSFALLLLKLLGEPSQARSKGVNKEPFYVT